MNAGEQLKYGHINGGRGGFNVPVTDAENIQARSGRFVTCNAGYAEIADAGDTLLWGSLEAPTDSSTSDDEYFMIDDPTAIFRIPIITGTYVASILNYLFGKGYFSDKLVSLLDGKKVRKYEKIFEKYGKWGLFLAAIGPVPWVPFCWLAGSFKMKFEKFFLWGLFPRLLRILVFVLLVWKLHIILF